MKRLRRVILCLSLLAMLGAEPQQVYATALSSPPWLANQPLYKIEINRDGLYQITYEDLQRVGLPVDQVNPGTFHIFNQGIEIPLFRIGDQDEYFEAGEAFLFYGVKTRTRYTEINAYWLTYGNGPTLTMQETEGAAVGNASPLNTYTENLRLEKDSSYLSNNGTSLEDDHWLWDFMAAAGAPNARTYEFQLDHLVLDPGDAQIKGVMHGYSARPEHHTRIYLNEYLIDDHLWPANSDYLFSTDIPTSLLLEGNNRLRVEQPCDGGISIDQIFTNWFEVHYPRRLMAQDGQLLFNANQSGEITFEVGGFPNSEIEVFDVTYPQAPIRIKDGTVQEDSGAYRMVFAQRVEPPRRYLVIDPSGRLSPLSITPTQPADLKNPSNQADYLLVSHPDFLAAIQPLADFRARQGYRVRVINVQDIYDVFGDGVFDPEAIHDFLAYAYANWKPPAPAFVLLVGDGHYDFKDNYGDSGPVFMPPYLGDFDPWMGETASDNRYVTVSGEDALPDMAIGRLPANSPAEATSMVNKILAYEQGATPGLWTSHLTFVADDPDAGGDFPGDSDRIADSALLSRFSVEKIYYPTTHPTPEDAQKAILAAINQGTLLVNFTGHASYTTWAVEKLFGNANVNALTNHARYPFFVSMTCQDGYFIQPKGLQYNYPSLAETLLRADGKGSIGSFSPTGFGFAAGHDLLSQGLYQAIFQEGLTQLGPATTAAKVFLNAAGVGHTELIDTYMLFGDPATRLNLFPWKVSLPMINR